MDLVDDDRPAEQQRLQSVGVAIARHRKGVAVAAGLTHRQHLVLAALHLAERARRRKELRRHVAHVQQSLALWRERERAEPLAVAVGAETAGEEGDVCAVYPRVGACAHARAAEERRPERS
eukprot:7384901-Prymnesium_polylepis.3